MKTAQGVSVAIALLFASAASAQTYIVPEGDCGAVALHLTLGSDFPSLGGMPALDGVASAYVHRQDREGRVALQPAAGARSLIFNTEVPGGEIVVMAAVELDPAVRGTETRTDHAKALLFCGPTTPIADWQYSMRLGLEIVPQGWNGPRPKLKAGDPMRFIAVVDGKTLLGDLPMQLHRAGRGPIAEGVPAPGGGMTFPYQEPGRYMVVTTHRRPDPGQPDHWLVDTSTLTFDIR